MTKRDEKSVAPTSPFGLFKDLTHKLVSVPKKEVDAKEAVYQGKKARKKPRSA